MSFKVNPDREPYLADTKFFTRELTDNALTEEYARPKVMHWMRCPRDGSELKKVTSQGILVEVCPICNGLWLSAEALLAWQMRTELKS